MNRFPIQAYEPNFSIDGYSSFLNQYQMLIIGFWDSYRIDSGTDLQDASANTGKSLHAEPGDGTGGCW